MTPTSSTADRLGLSYKERAMTSARIAQACSMSLEDTNILVETARRQGMQNQAKKAQFKIETVEIPDDVLLHLDGKIMKVKVAQITVVSTYLVLSSIIVKMKFKILKLFSVCQKFQMGQGQHKKKF